MFAPMNMQSQQAVTMQQMQAAGVQQQQQQVGNNLSAALLANAQVNPVLAQALQQQQQQQQQAQQAQQQQQQQLNQMIMAQAMQQQQQQLMQQAALQQLQQAQVMKLMAENGRQAASNVFTTAALQQAMPQAAAQATTAQPAATAATATTPSDNVVVVVVPPAGSNVPARPASLTTAATDLSSKKKFRKEPRIGHSGEKRCGRSPARDSDWACPNCENCNWESRMWCKRCGTTKPALLVTRKNAPRVAPIRGSLEDALMKSRSAAPHPGQRNGPAEAQSLDSVVCGESHHSDTSSSQAVSEEDKTERDTSSPGPSPTNDAAARSIHMSELGDVFEVPQPTSKVDDELSHLLSAISQMRFEADQ